MHFTAEIPTTKCLTDPCRGCPLAAFIAGHGLSMELLTAVEPVALEAFSQVNEGANPEIVDRTLKRDYAGEPGEAVSASEINLVLGMRAAIESGVKLPRC